MSTTSSPHVSNSIGVFDGTRFALRSFPVWYRWREVPNQNKKRPESGIVAGVEFVQTMGRIILSYPLRDQMGHLKEEDFLVELSCWELRVSVRDDMGMSKTGFKPISALSGELAADVRRNLSWWKIADDGGKLSRRLVIYLTKLEHRAWKGPWFTDPLNIHKKGHFGWTQQHTTQQLMKSLKLDDETMSPLEPGEPQDWDKEICTGIAPQRLCTGIDDDEEDSRFIYVIIHLDEEAMENVMGRIPPEELFAANVEAGYLEVLQRGDGFGICWGPLAGKVIPDQTTWEITSVRRKNLPKESNIKCPAFFNPALKIKLVKAKDPAKNPNVIEYWGHAFSEINRPYMEPPRERVPWTARVQRALVLSPGAPLNTPLKAQRALKLCTSIESSQDLLLNRVIVILHLEERLVELAARYMVDLSTFFSMKVGERILEVSVVADAEFTMCVGGLCGSCVPDATSWEIFTAKNPDGEGEHLAIRIFLTKADHCRGPWADAFTRFEPWQVAAHLRQAEQAAIKGKEDADGDATKSLDPSIPD